jgi:uncharacterized protein (DUF2235 family)
MSKNIIVCTDGTWNHPDDSAADPHQPSEDTNVVKLFQHLLGEPNVTPPTMIKSVDKQVAFYDDGVGAVGNAAVRVIEGAIGAGLDVKLQDAYGFIIKNYVSGDSIYLFGFSRGAYTARSLGGMLTRCGVPSRTAINNEAAQEALQVYRHNMDLTTEQFRKKYLSLPTDFGCL